MRDFHPLPVVCAVLLVWAVPSAVAQFPEDSPLFDQQVESEGHHLDDLLKNHPDLEDIHYPLKYAIPVDFYREEPTTPAYTQNVIFDPCRGRAYNCCSDTYGTPEFISVATSGDIIGQDILRNSLGEIVDDQASRWPTNARVLDEDCDDVASPNLKCLGERVRRKDFDTSPFCWNHQDTVIANEQCRAPNDGSPLPQCIEIGFSQTAYIVECGGEFENDNHCGTYLEIHRPGSDYQSILAEVKLRGQLTSGYRMTVMSTTYKGNASRSLCVGDHEVWWVLRTRYDWVIQKKISFSIVSPRCEWDPVNDQYFEYAVSSRAEIIFGLDPFVPERFLPQLTRTKITGEPGYPGVGMGSTLVLAEDSADLQSEGELPGINELEWQPPSRPTIDEFETRYNIDLDEDGIRIPAQDDDTF